VFSPLAIHAQVIKKIRKNRITKVDERLIIGCAGAKSLESDFI
jgi:hypothetical protein